jgi:hypothetical protein
VGLWCVLLLEAAAAVEQEGNKKSSSSNMPINLFTTAANGMFLFHARRKMGKRLGKFCNYSSSK